MIYNFLMQKKEIVNALNSEVILKDGNFKNDFFEIADNVRYNNLGDGVHLRGLIEFTNYCYRNCYYCGIRAENSNTERYRLSLDEILSYAKKGISLGLKTVVLQGGEDLYFNLDKMLEVISEIKKLGVILTLSVGEKSYKEYKAYRQAGADRFLLRIETSDENLFKQIHPNSDFKNRINCLYNLKELGFEVGTGVMVGLPNQSVESLANDILFFKSIEADMIGLGPFIPTPNTPFENEKFIGIELPLKVLAISRILNPKANMPATTAFESIHKNGRIIALKCGANVVMPNLLDCEINKKYKIYKDKSTTPIEAIKEEIISIGRVIL